MSPPSHKSISTLVRLEGQRFRESHGLYYDDFDIGDIYEHRPGRTITATDNTWQSLVNMNTHPLHIDGEYAGSTEFGRIVVSSLVTFSIVGGLSLSSTSARGIANLGWDKVRLLAPVFVGDTVFAESTVLAKRLSQSRPHQGIVTVQTCGLKQDGVRFLQCERSFLVPTRAAEAASAGAGA